MRLFLGIELPQESKNNLYKKLEGLRLKHPDFKWVRPENYHITLHFFGEVLQPDEVAKRIKDILYDAQSFYISSHKMDIFVHKQLILHLTFLRSKKMEELVTTVQTDLGVEDKIFLPHITLSKSAMSSKQQYYALENEIDKIEAGLDFNVDRIYLFESILTGKYPVYNKFAEFPLL